MAADNKVANAEAQLQATLNVIPAYTWYALPSGALTFVNERTAEYLGLPKDHPLRFGIDTGAEWDSHIPLLHPDDREDSRNAWSTCLRTGRAGEFRFRVRDGKGEYRWFLSRAEPLRASDGTILHWIGVNLEIDDAKRAEQDLQLMSRDLQESKAKLEEAQRITHVGYWEWDLATNRVTWSDETYRIHGMRPQERPMDLATVREKIHPDDSEGVFQALEEALRGGARCNVECRVFRPTGEVRIIHSLSDVKRDASGQPSLMFGTIQDITDRKHAEDKIRRLVDANILGVFIWNLEGAIVEANEAFLHMVQYSREDLLSGRLRWTDLTPAEWRGRGERALAEVRATGTTQPYEKEYFRKDGSRVPALTGGATFQGGGNEGVAFVLDLSEQKRAEQKIREQEMELRQILDFASWHVAVLGADGQAIYLNKAGLDYHGLTFEAWQDYDPHRLIHPDDHDRILTGAGGAKLLSDQPFETEARLVRKDRKCRWFLFRFNPLREGEGRITRWYVTATDIDDRKRAEERLQLENAALREEIDQTSMFEELVGTSPALQTVLSRISKVAPSDSTVLITGETGTGKELVARAIHRRSQRSGRAFVSVNCAAIPRDLIASELFGHEKGAFTGAMQRRLGRFEMADGGTIFLDEVGELSPDTQVALLRVLQEREFERVGGVQPIHVDLRVIAATNRDLKTAVATGTFRQDLFYRLNVFPIEVPPLRERKDDILMLVEYFAQRYASRAGKNIRLIEKKTLELLQSYGWPGNIRELQNVIERSVILSSGEVFSVDESWLSKETSRPASRVEAPAPLKGKVEPRSEREIIEAVLAETRGRVSGPSGAAAKLGIPPSTLDHRIKALKIHKRQFKFR